MTYTEEVMAKLKSQYSYEPEFLQAVQEVLGSLSPVLEKNEKYRKKRIHERLTEPERTIGFRVDWVDDAGNIQVNQG